MAGIVQQIANKLFGAVQQDASNVWNGVKRSASNFSNDVADRWNNSGQSGWLSSSPWNPKPVEAKGLIDPSATNRQMTPQQIEMLKPYGGVIPNEKVFYEGGFDKTYPDITPRFKKPQSTSTPTPTPTPTTAIQQMGGVNFDDIERKIRAGFRAYGQGKKLPAEDLIPVMMEAIKTYPIFQQNPYLIPQISILETSAGQNITRPNNLINYGVRNPQINDLFSKVGIEDALRRSLKEIGQTGSTFAKYRTGSPLTPEQLQELARTYEPMNNDYYDNLAKGIQLFSQY